ncbi:Pup--protein ligase [Corynebacterium breve]|uniref:Pup--protein ligase n=1 Tax=Corynebacterium breve TaxID=3049799 RepID=A0ABY8VKT1_9CORY|nr:Pup--protein ligase [Corynebacterium breve]WIM68838.1 Pup--protein ligase [Corynebacterium breve]
MSPVFARRITGVETEFGITATRDGRAVLGPEEVARYLFRPIVAKYRSSNIFTSSAARLYLDVGSHPEYATAECDSLTQLLNHDKAGEVIYHRLALQAEQALADDGIGGQVYLFKNNVDSMGNSYGAHENYLISREMVLKSLGKQMLPFMITRQLICGAGMIKDGQFVLSQRADQVWEGVSSATTRTRPVINTRDEPHGDSHRFRRMHVIVGDSNMSETTFALKIGSTLLLLEMLEADFELASWELENPINEIRKIAADPTGLTPLKLVTGETVTALEVQRGILESAKRWLEVRPDEGTPNEEMARVVDLWERTLTAIDSQDFSGVDTEIDWVIKRKLLEQYKNKLACDWTHPKLAHIDLAYHDIHPERSLFYLLQRKGLAARWTTDEAIVHAADTAPETTRAHLRGQFLAAAEETGAAISVDWVHMKAERPEPRTVELLDPFLTEDAQVDELIAYMRENQEAK